jgi:very-short-patch-repair endonuclease
MRLLGIAASIAERQLGLVARRQLTERGVAPTTIDDAVQRGQLLPVHRGVYRLPGTPETAEVRVLARVLAAGAGALLSHRSAAWLWDLLPAPSRHELSVPYPGRARRIGMTVHRSADLGLAIPGRVRGLPVTGVGRTILDCAVDPTIDLELLVDAARRHHGISRTLLPATIAAHARRGRPGIERLRDQVVGTEMPHSDFERLVARWLIDAGITGWTMHHRIVVPGRGPVEIDFSWPEQMVVLELEGCDHRLRSTVHDDDTERQNWITLSGFTVLRTTYKRWLSQTARVRREIEAALAAAPAGPVVAAAVPQRERRTAAGLVVPRA